MDLHFRRNISNFEYKDFDVCGLKKMGGKLRKQRNPSFLSLFMTYIFSLNIYFLGSALNVCSYFCV